MCHIPTIPTIPVYLPYNRTQSEHGKGGQKIVYLRPGRNRQTPKKMYLKLDFRAENRAEELAAVTSYSEK